MAANRDDSVLIPLRGAEGMYTRIDLADAPFAQTRVWRLNNEGYVVSQNKKGRAYLHRALLAAASGTRVDHVNGDPMDNRRANLRLCEAAQNSWNRGATRANRLGVKHVWYQAKRKRYCAAITCRGERRFARFKTLAEAADWARRASLELHGQFSPFSRS